MRGRQSHAAKPIQFRLYACRSQLRTKKVQSPVRVVFNMYVWNYFLWVIPPVTHYSYIVSDIPFGSTQIISGISYLFCHSTWRSVRHILWHSIWHLFRHSFWHSIWHLFQHSIWCLAFHLTFYLMHILTSSLAFSLACVRVQACCSGPEVLHSIWSWRYGVQVQRV